MSGQLAEMRPFEMLSNGSAIPVFDVSDRLRQRGWQVPAYTMSEGAEVVAVLRIVVREGFSRDLGGMLLDDVREAVDHFTKHPLAPVETPAAGFAR